MRIAYLDSSCLVAIAFGERGAAALARRLTSFDELVASNLLEPELRASFVRETAEVDSALWAGLSWIIPDRPLTPEIARSLDAVYVRGADCWHLATARYLAEDPALLGVLTLDERQERVARALGFGNTEPGVTPCHFHGFVLQPPPSSSVAALQTPLRLPPAATARPPIGRRHPFS